MPILVLIVFQRALLNAIKEKKITLTLTRLGQCDCKDSEMEEIHTSQSHTS
jgi:hypothetical protein